MPFIKSRPLLFCLLSCLAAVCLSQLASDTSQKQISCKGKSAKFCPDIYDPVCAHIPIWCITTPCPQYQDFGNSCDACSGTGSDHYYKGTCAEVFPTKPPEEIAFDFDTQVLPMIEVGLEASLEADVEAGEGELSLGEEEFTLLEAGFEAEASFLLPPFWDPEHGEKPFDLPNPPRETKRDSDHTDTDHTDTDDTDGPPAPPGMHSGPKPHPGGPGPKHPGGHIHHCDYPRPGWCSSHDWDPVCIVDCRDHGSYCPDSARSPCEACSNYNVLSYRHGECDYYPIKKKHYCAAIDYRFYDYECPDDYDPVCVYPHHCYDHYCAYTVSNPCQACWTYGADYYTKGDCPYSPIY